MASNEIENLKQLVRNWITALLQVLETENSANIVLLMDSMAEVHEAVRVLGCRILAYFWTLGCQMLQNFMENGMHTEVFEREILREFPDNTGILELAQELNPYNI